MSNLEEKSIKRKRKENIQKAVLSAVKIAGLLSVAAVAPNSIQYLKSLGLIPTRRHEEVILRTNPLSFPHPILI